MIVVFDTSVLLLAIDPSVNPPLDPSTNAPLSRAAERIEYLIERLAEEKSIIVISTPVLSEILIYAGGAGAKWLQYFNGTAVFRIAAFDQKAAVEAALSARDAIERGGMKVDAPNSSASRAKVKFDRQIVAIAKAEGASAIYSDDDHVARIGKAAGLQVYTTAELDLPPDDPQQSLTFE